LKLRRREGGSKAGDVEVAEHLGHMGLVECGDDLGIDDDRVVDDEVGNEGADVMRFVMNRELLLRVATEALLGEFDNESTLVDFLVEPGLEGVEDRDRGADDDFGEFLIVGKHGLV